MEDELIKRNEAIRTLTDKNIINHMDSVQDGELHRVKRAVRRIITEMSTIDATPVQHGYWKIKYFGDKAQCSICNMTFDDVYDLENYDNYCRHCGSIMESIKIIKKDNI